jgi:hypothetical protein
MPEYTLKLTELQLNVLDKYLHKHVDAEDLQTVTDILESICAIQERILTVRTIIAGELKARSSR